MKEYKTIKYFPQLSPITKSHLLCVLVAFILMASSCSFFQPYENPRTTIESRMDDLNAVGMQVACVSAEGPTWLENYGYSDLETGVLVDNNTMFQIASISKTIVATTLMGAVEDGILELDTDINDYLSVDFKVQHPDYPDQKITPRMLASHSAGIGSLIFTHDYGEHTFHWKNNESYMNLNYYLSEFLFPGGEYYSEDSWIAKPGTSTNYSNEGIALLAYVIESALQNQEVSVVKTFQGYCQERILTPLRMNGYWFLGDIPDSYDLAIPYSIATGKALPFTAPPAWPSGSFTTSASEYAKLIEMILNKGNFRKQRILSETSINEMLKIQKGNYAIVWNKNGVKVNGNSFLSHNGGLDGVHTDVYLDIENKLGFIVFSNTDFVHPWSYQEILKALDIKMRTK